MRHSRTGVNSKIADIPAGYSLDYYDWSEDGAALWAVLGGTSGLSLWRIVPGGTPTKIGPFALATDDTGPVGDPRQAGIGVLHDGNLHVIDTSTGVDTQVTGCDPTTGCAGQVYDSVIDRSSDGRWLVEYTTGGTRSLGWLAADGTSLTNIYDFTPSGDFGSLNENVFAKMVSPDGQHILMHGNQGFDEFDHVLGSSTRLVGEHTDWQPCPNGVCATYAAAVTAPGAPHIGRAASGAAGGKSTATAKWSAPGSGGSAITGYTVQARKLNSANHVVSTKSVVRPATARSYAMPLAPGRYSFRVRATNKVGTGAWSASSNIVRAR